MLFLLACTATVPLGSTGEYVLPGEEYVDETGLEEVGGIDPGTGGQVVFDDTVVHEVELELSDHAWTSLQYDPKTYTEVLFQEPDGDMEIGLRLKGNTQYRTIDDKPSLILDFNRYVSEQHWDGLASVYLHNMTYDPSNLHEHLAYLFFRRVEVPASRSAYAHLTINDIDYGIYLLLEKQNALFNENWFGESEGGTWEAGSFNHPCDVNDAGCDCWETDTEGDLPALLELCEAAQADDFMAATEELIDWDQFLRQITAEMAIAHYDNYGWNINNYRVHRVPSTGRFHWTPWSTDLAFGWYPWSSSPHCGEFGTVPSDHSTGYLTARCWADETCRDRIFDGLEEHASNIEDADLVTEMSARLELIDTLSAADGRSWYNETQRANELACMVDWIENRPTFLREWAELYR